MEELLWVNLIFQKQVEGLKKLTATPSNIRALDDVIQAINDSELIIMGLEVYIPV